MDSRKKLLKFRSRDMISLYNIDDEERSDHVKHIRLNIEQILNSQVGAGVLDSIQHWRRMSGTISNLNQEIIPTIREITKVDKMMKVLRFTSDEIEQIWVEDIWISIKKNSQKRVGEVIRDELCNLIKEEMNSGNNDIPTEGNLFVIVLLRILNPTFNYYCKNKCGKSDIDKYKRTKEECTSMLDYIRTMPVEININNDVFLSLFDRHFFMAFGCSLIGNKYRIASINSLNSLSRGGTSNDFMYNKHKYKVHVGIKGGKYIVVNGHKRYI